MSYNFSPLKQKIKDIEEWLKRELSGIRTGRASPLILDSVSTEAYGGKMAINKLGAIAVEDARTIRITPWDKTQIKTIEKAILVANIGVSVSIDEAGLRLSFPELTSERRIALIKLVKDKLEGARISLRTEREAVWSDIQKKEREGTMSEDDKFRYKDEMQKLVDETNRTLGEIAKRKESEVMA